MAQRARKNLTNRERAREIRIREAWERQVTKLHDWLDELEELPSMHGPKWKAKMLAHYRKQLDALIAAEPPKPR